MSKLLQLPCLNYFVVVLQTLKNQVYELRRRGIKPTGNEVQEIERLSSGIAVLKKENYKNMKLSEQHDDRIQVSKIL